MKKILTNITMAIFALFAPVSVFATSTHAPDDERAVVVERAQASDRQPSVKVDDDIMELVNPGAEPLKFEIFSITGQLIKAVTVKENPVKIRLPKGFYIVKCESWTKRLMLK